MFRIRFSFRCYTVRIVRLIIGTAVLSAGKMEFRPNSVLILITDTSKKTVLNCKKNSGKVIKRMSNIFAAMSERIRSDNSICYKKQ